MAFNEYRFWHHLHQVIVKQLADWEEHDTNDDIADAIVQTVQGRLENGQIEMPLMCWPKHIEVYVENQGHRVYLEREP